MSINRCTSCGSYEYAGVRTCRVCGDFMESNGGTLPEATLNRLRNIGVSSSAKVPSPTLICICGNDTYRWLKNCSECGCPIDRESEKANGTSHPAKKDGSARTPKQTSNRGSGLTHPVPAIATIYRERAIAGARALPEVMDPDLLDVWCADTRGESFTFESTPEGFGQAIHHAMIELKNELETAARSGAVSVDEAQNGLWLNIIWQFAENSTINLHEAFRAYCSHLRTGKVDFAVDSDLYAAKEKIHTLVGDWLTRNNIRHFVEPSMFIPQTRLLKALKGFEGMPDVHFHPAIPQEKLRNAVTACGVPDDEEIALLVDCTYFGSAKDALLFGKKAVYFSNGATSGFLPYSQFSERTFNHCPGSQTQVSIGEGIRIELNGSNLDAPTCIRILETVRKEASTVIPRDDKKGLESIPGMHALKKTLTEDVINVLKHADEYKKYGLALPNGLLFYGPPGCGKTFMAQRLAKELDYNFYEISPGSLASPYIHDTVLKIKQSFDSAAKSAPAVIFADEFEGLVPSRSSLSGDAQYKAEEVTEWLTQIGSCSDRKILFIAATNEPWKIDDAIRRTGRLDKKIYIGPPDRDAIKEMVSYHCKGRPVEDEVMFDMVASQIDGQGYSASDLKALVDEAARLAMRDRGPICVKHFEIAATEKVLPSISAEAEAVFAGFR
jgi:ATP-dependent 26S proteasome regulatory subunit